MEGRWLPCCDQLQSIACSCYIATNISKALTTSRKAAERYSSKRSKNVRNGWPMKHLTATRRPGTINITSNLHISPIPHHITMKKSHGNSSNGRICIPSPRELHA